MKNPELFHKTIGILVNAYFKGKLAHGDCAACAVGNICANYVPILKGKSVSEDDFNNAIWIYAFGTNKGIQHIEPLYYRGNVKKVIDLTGYSLYQLAAIEKAFETADKGCYGDEWMFNGLMSVCDTLMQIHEATNEEIKEAKSLFVKELTV